MNFKDILDLTKNRIDELDEDEQIDIIIKNAINEAQIEIAEIDTRFQTNYIPVINGAATLPDDLYKIEKITPELIEGEYQKGNAIFSDRNTTFTIVYSSVPETLESDTDEPSISIKNHYLLSTYACYTYYSYKKKNNIAQIYLAEYQNALNKLKSTNKVGPKKFTNNYREDY